MKCPRKGIRAWLAVGGLALFIVGSFLGFAFLPGSLEGNYAGSSLHGVPEDQSYFFTRFEEGRGTAYMRDSSRATYCYRYDLNSDGSVSIYALPVRLRESEKLFRRAYPRRLLTKFVDPDTGDSEWHWKSPNTQSRRDVLATHQIQRFQMTSEDKFVRITYQPGFREPQTTVGSMP